MAMPCATCKQPCPPGHVFCCAACVREALRPSPLTAKAAAKARKTQRERRLERIKERHRAQKEST